MVDVGEMHVAVRERCVRMLVRVRLARRIVGTMLVAMMLVVRVAVTVRLHFVRVLVFISFASKSHRRQATRGKSFSSSRASRATAQASTSIARVVCCCSRA